MFTANRGSAVGRIAVALPLFILQTPNEARTCIGQRVDAIELGEEGLDPRVARWRDEPPDVDLREMPGLRRGVAHPAWTVPPQPPQT